MPWLIMFLLVRGNTVKNVAKFAAIALIAAPSFASAGSNTAPMIESDPYVDTTEASSSSAGSLGSLGAGGAVALGVLAVAAIAAAKGS